MEAGAGGLPSLRTLSSLAGALGVQVSYLVSPMDHDGVVMAAI